MNRKLYLAAVLFGTVALCGAVSPLSQKSPSPLNGKVSVGPFTYLPAKAKELAPNQAASIGGPISFEQNVDFYLRKAAISTLRSRGILTENTGKILLGEIQECRVLKYVNAPTDCAITIEYQVSAGGAVTYRSTKQVWTRKVFNTQIALEDALDQNVSALLEDSAFLDAIK